jgi:hypothetical protein
MSYDDGHQGHGHLDNGRCLDGSGRTWERMTDDDRSLLWQRMSDATDAKARAAIGEGQWRSPVELSLLLRRLDRVALYLFLLTLAQVLSGVALLRLAL